MSADRDGRKSLPTVKAFVEPILNALRRGGGTATVAEMLEVAIHHLRLSPEQLDIPHNAQRGKRSEVSYRMAWARSGLRARGTIERTSRGHWVLKSQTTED